MGTGTSIGRELAARRGSGEGGSGGNGREGDDGTQGLAAGGGVPQRTYVTGMMMGLGGILMFFMALVSAYVVRKGMPNNGWVALPALPGIVWLNTLILISSSVALAVARARFRLGEGREFRRWWAAATALGIFFLAGQVIAWRELASSGVYLASNPSGSFFYVLSAAHGLHLAGGIVALAWVVMFPTRRLTLGTATEIAAMYWHFMDGLWVFLFLLLTVAR
jgi:cytochrome c oxidase subunit III